MTKSDWSLVGLNVFTLAFAVLGLTAQDPDPMTAALVFTVITTLVNGVWAIRRSRPREAAPVALSQSEREVDTMDIHRVLEIDQRLEALERAEERRLLALADAGVISAPADLADAQSDAVPARQRV